MTRYIYVQSPPVSSAGSSIYRLNLNIRNIEMHASGARPQLRTRAKRKMGRREIPPLPTFPRAINYSISSLIILIIRFPLNYSVFFVFLLINYSFFPNNYLLAKEPEPSCPTITFPCHRMRKVCENIRRAIKGGKPTRLHRITDRKAINNNARLAKCARKLCAQYPFAMTREGTDYHH